MAPSDTAGGGSGMVTADELLTHSVDFRLLKLFIYVVDGLLNHNCVGV